MKNAHRLKNDIDVKPLYDEIDMSMWQNAPFDGHPIKNFPDSSQQILLGWTKHLNKVFSLYDDVLPKDLQNMLLSDFLPTKLYFKYPNLHKFLLEFTEVYGGKITRATYYTLSPKSRVGIHIDAEPDNYTGPRKKNEEALYRYKDRFHLVLTGKYLYYINGQIEKFLKGELWWFNNKKQHGSYNYGNTIRTILVFDVKNSHWREMI